MCQTKYTDRNILYPACLSIVQNHRHPYALIIFSEIFNEHFSVSRKLKEQSASRSSGQVCYFVLEFIPLGSQFLPNCLHTKSCFPIQHSRSSSHSTLIQPVQIKHLMKFKIRPSKKTTRNCRLFLNEYEQSYKNIPLTKEQCLCR